jgi:hypothetical protein
MNEQPQETEKSNEEEVRDTPSGEGTVAPANGARDELPDLKDALDVVSTANSSSDFTSEYLAALEVVELSYLNRMMEGFREFRSEDSVVAMREASRVRTEFLHLLEVIAGDSKHPMAADVADLRAEGEVIRSLFDWLGNCANAIVLYRSGHWSVAIETLESHDVLSQVTLDDELMAVMSAIAGSLAEMLSADIRSAVRDHSGARAGYDRAAAAVGKLVEVFSESEDGADEYQRLTLEYEQKVAESGSQRMRFNQYLEANDYAGAALAAREASECLLSAAELFLKADPASVTLLVPLLRASAEEQLAKHDGALAEVALEARDWDRAVELSSSASDRFNAASKICLESRLPGARVTQERLLADGFSFNVQFRRRLERERSSVERFEEVKAELRDLYSDLRGALTPAGVTVNNRTELVNSVEQQVEVVTRLETRVREVLREVPAALEQSDLDAVERKQLMGEARSLADSSDGGPEFLLRARSFGGKLQAALEKGASVAGPITALVKALSMLV